MSGSKFPSPDWLSPLLEQEIFSRLSHYKELRHNHVPHGIVAMARLGASELQVKEYLDELNKYLPELNLDAEPTETLDIDFLKSDNLLDYRGKNCGTYVMKEKYEELCKTKYNGDMVAMVKDFCPALIDGPFLAAFHGIISLAYGYVGKSDHTMLEGLIFMDQQYSPMVANENRKDLSTFGKGKKSIFDVLQDIHENKELLKKIPEETKKDLEEKPVRYVQSVYAWSVWAHHGQYFDDITDELKLPEWFDPTKEDMQQIVKLIDWFFDMATVVYVKSEAKNDFFLLHGITASWSFKQILPLLDYKTALLGFRATVSTLLGVYAFQGAPALTLGPEAHFKGDVTTETWEKFIQATLKEISAGKKYEMHGYKLVQVCYENWVERKDSEYASYYFAAAHEVLENKYHFPGGLIFPNDDITL